MDPPLNKLLCRWWSSYLLFFSVANDANTGTLVSIWEAAIKKPYASPSRCKTGSMRKLLTTSTQILACIILLIRVDLRSTLLCQIPRWSVYTDAAVGRKPSVKIPQFLPSVPIALYESGQNLALDSRPWSTLTCQFSSKPVYCVALQRRKTAILAIFLIWRAPAPSPFHQWGPNVVC